MISDKQKYFMDCPILQRLKKINPKKNYPVNLNNFQIIGIPCFTTLMWMMRTGSGLPVFKGQTMDGTIQMDFLLVCKTTQHCMTFTYAHSKIKLALFENLKKINKRQTNFSYMCLNYRIFFSFWNIITHVGIGRDHFHFSTFLVRTQFFKCLSLRWTVTL